MQKLLNVSSFVIVERVGGALSDFKILRFLGSLPFRGPTYTRKVLSWWRYSVITQRMSNTYLIHKLTINRMGKCVEED